VWSEYFPDTFVRKCTWRFSKLAFLVVRYLDWSVRNTLENTRHELTSDKRVKCVDNLTLSSKMSKYVDTLIKLEFSYRYPICVTVTSCDFFYGEMYLCTEFSRLRTGWSVKTNQFNIYPKPQPLTDKEQQAIVAVIKKAEELELYEQHRVG